MRGKLLSNEVSNLFLVTCVYYFKWYINDSKYEFDTRPVGSINK